MTWHPWTLDDLVELRKQYGTRTNARLAQFFKRTVVEIETKALELALAKDKRAFLGQPMPRWTDVEVATLRMLHETKPNREIAIILGRSLKSVTSKANMLRLRKGMTRLQEMGRANVATRRDRNRGED